MKKQRKHYTPEKKVAILRRHLLEQVPIRSCVTNRDSSPRSSTAGRRSSSATARLPFSRKRGPTIPEAEADRLSGEEDPTKDEVLGGTVRIADGPEVL